jgi:DNA-binding LacI/PurR family transcriptional regulator
MPRVTITDVARDAGVSKGLASLALNGKPGVAEATRARVVASADRLGWHPHFAARALANSSSGAYGLVISRPTELISSEYFFMALVSGIEQGLSERGIALVMQVVRDPAEEMRLLETWAAERRVDGVLLLDIRHPDPRIDHVSRLGLPAVAFAVHPMDDCVPALISDERARMEIVTEHLLDLGHREILYFTGAAAYEHVAVRSQHLSDLAAERGARVRAHHSDYEHPDVDELLAQWVAAPEHSRPTAMVVDNDLLAIRLVSAANARGIDVPGQLSVIALEDSIMCTLITPPVTALRRDVTACGAQLVKVLADQISGSTAEALAAADGVTAPAADATAPVGDLQVRASTARVTTAG